MLAFSFLSLASLALAAPLARRQATDAISSREPIAARWQMRECSIFPDPLQKSKFSFVITDSFYAENGTRQACGNYSSDLDFVVGLPLALYNTSSPSPLCGAFVVVTNPLNSLSAIAKVVGASNSSALALSVAAWREIRGDATEMQDVSFRFANESETATGAAYAAANFNDASPSQSLIFAHQFAVLMIISLFRSFDDIHFHRHHSHIHPDRPDRCRIIFLVVLLRSLVLSLFVVDFFFCDFDFFVLSIRTHQLWIVVRRIILGRSDFLHPRRSCRSCK